MWLNCILGILSVSLSLAFVWGMKWTIDIATEVKAGSLDVAISLLIAFVAGQVLANFISSWVRALLGVRMRNALQASMLSRLLQATWTDLRKVHTTDIVSRMTTDVDIVANLINEQIPLLLTILFQLCGAFAFLYLLDNRLALIVVIVAPAFVLLSKLFMRRLHNIAHAIRESESHVLTCIQESLRHSTIVKTFDRIAYIGERLTLQQQHLQAKVIERTRYSSISQMMMNVGFATGYLFTFIWGVKHLQAGIITYGSLTAFIQLVGQIQGPIRSLTRFVPILVSAATAIERLMELDQLEHEQDSSATVAISSHPNSTAVAGTLTIVPPPLTFHQVSFRYPGEEQWVLSAFSHTFRPGSVTAIQGATGSGKTTLVRLMLSLLRPTMGNVILGDTPITPTTRRYLTYVPQGNSLFSGSIRENLLLAAPAASDEQMAEALRHAAADFVFSLPQGLDAICTESGGGISEGQAQRLCIARALRAS
ncbi:MAG: ABC transporter ATP-binding protein [Alloprevotella sp.]